MNYKVWIKQAVIDYILTNGNEHLPNETGGVLIGYRASTYEFVITDIICPGPNAIHKPSSFQPDQSYHQKQIAFKYEQSKRMETYLGDWHTHPNSHPYLSPTDKRTINKIAQHRDARLESPLMLIASPPTVGFKIWVYEKPTERSRINHVEVEINVF